MQSTAMGGNIERLCRYFARLVADELRAGGGGMQPQHGSPLGARRHRAAVERRVERKLGGAYIRGKDFLLSPEALDEELERLTAERLTRGLGIKKARPRSPELEALERELKTGVSRIRKGKDT